MRFYLLLIALIYLKNLQIDACESKAKKSYECGTPSISPSINPFSLNSRILDGASSVTGSWPWSVYIETLSGGSYSFTCGGTLISDQYVVTYGACLPNLSLQNSRVIIGITDRSTRTDANAYSIMSLITHPNIDYTTLMNNIGLIRLSKKVAFSSFIYPICLPESSDKTLVYNKNLVTIGWGSSSSDTAFGNPLLQAVVKVSNGLGVASCSPKESTHYCTTSTSATFPNQGACLSDAGSPLMYFTNGRWYLYGINCAAASCNPGFHTVVPDYIDFVKNYIG